MTSYMGLIVYLSVIDDKLNKWITEDIRKWRKQARKIRHGEEDAHQAKGAASTEGMAKAFHCVGHKKLWKLLKNMGIPDPLTCLLRNQYAGQVAIVRTRRGTTDLLKIGKGAQQGCILSPCLFNLYVKYIMWNALLDESQLESRLPGEISTTSDMQIIQV